MRAIGENPFERIAKAGEESQMIKKLAEGLGGAAELEQLTRVAEDFKHTGNEEAEKIADWILTAMNKLNRIKKEEKVEIAALEQTLDRFKELKRKAEGFIKANPGLINTEYIQGEGKEKEKN